MSARAGEIATDDVGALTAAVRDVIAKAGIPDPDVPLRLARIPGGASRETWVMEAEAGGGPRYVLRRDPPGADSRVMQRAEWELIGLAAQSGVPVPPPLAFEPAGGRFGTAGMLLGHVAGESVAPRVLRSPRYARARPHLLGQLAAALAAIHSIDRLAASEALGVVPEDPALAAIEAWEAELDQVGEPLPAIELGLRWLRRNRPEPAEATVVHGDFRLGNFIVNENGLAAVIDWELAHLGDPAEDVGWLCIRSWRFGNDDRPAGGLGSLEDFLAAYREAGGRELAAERVRYWEVFGNVKWAVICARQAQDHLTGKRRSHELASLGRRVCEPEWDLLGQIGGGP